MPRWYSAALMNKNFLDTENSDFSDKKSVFPPALAGGARVCVNQCPELISDNVN